MTSFLKWPGGKRWLVTSHSEIIPSQFKRYIEPFLGGGAVFFHLQPRACLLGDINSELVNTYLAIKKNWRLVRTHLRRHKELHAKEHYYNTRDRVPRGAMARAARFIYLNRTCFNGIYRVNSRGEFNVPIGTRDSVLHRDDDFRAVSALLSHATLLRSDFEALVDLASADDLVFADPPYSICHNLNGFVKYNEVLFSWSDQVRLANALQRAKERGAKIVATNANHETIVNLYEMRGFDLSPVKRYSSVSAYKRSRNSFDELLIRANC